MRWIALAAACAALSAWAAPAGAAEFIPAPNASYVIDLDTEAGNFSEWKLTDIRALNALRGKVSFLRQGKDQQWLPSCWVKVGAGKDFVRFVLWGVTGGPLAMRIEKVSGGKSVAQEPFFGQVQLGEPVDLEMEWTEQGSVTVTVRTKASPQGERRTMSLDAAPDHISVSTSTGEAKVEPMLLGRTTP